MSTAAEATTLTRRSLRAASTPEATAAKVRAAWFYPSVAAAYFVLRAISAGFMTVYSHRQDPRGYTGHTQGYWGMANMWDGVWYRRIAEQGYPDHVVTDAMGRPQQNALAFYPMFPMAGRTLSSWTGLSFEYVAPTLALILGLVASLLVAGLLRDRVGAPAAFAATTLWAAFPAAPALQMAYTESLAMVLLAGCLWLLMRRQWLLAALVAIATGLARPIAVPLGLVALTAVALRVRDRKRDPIPVDEWLLMAGTLVSCGVAGWLWPTLTARMTGQADAYTATMATWRASGKIEWFRPWLVNSRFLVGDKAPWLLLLLVVLLLVAVLGPWARALGWELRVWCLAYPAYLAAVLDPWTSVFRYLIPLFPLFVVMIGAGWTRHGDRADRPRWLMPVRLVTLLGLSLAWQAVWVSVLLVAKIGGDYPP